MALNSPNFTAINDGAKKYRKYTVEEVLEAARKKARSDSVKKDPFLSQYSSIVDSPDFDAVAEQGRQANNPIYSDWIKRATRNRIIRLKHSQIGNVVSFAENNADLINLANQGTLNGGSVHKEANEPFTLINKHMTDTEKAIYHYLVGSGDTKGADEYLKTMYDIFRQREGQEIADETNGIGQGEFWVQVGAGIENGVTGLKNLAHLVAGGEGEPVSSMQYASQALKEDDTGFRKFTTDLGYNFGNMLPSMSLGALSGSGLMGAITMGIGSGGNSYAEMKRQGYSDNQARLFGVLVGASEAALGSILGGITKLGGGSTGVFKTVADKLIPTLNGVISRIAVEYGGKVLDEGLEEGLQEFLEPIIKGIVTGEDIDWASLGEIAYAAILGMASAGVTEGVESIGTTAGAFSEAQSTKQAYSDPAAIKALAEDVVARANASKGKPSTKSTRVAERVLGRTEQGKEVSGFDLMSLENQQARQTVLSDTSKIETATAQRLSRLGEKGDVGKLARAIAKQATGEKLSSTEAKLIKDSKYGQRVANELDPLKIVSGEFSSDWVQEIGTESVYRGLYNKSSSTQTETTTTETTAPTAKKTAPISTSGQTETKSGEKVKIAEVASVKDGKMMLKLDNGKTVEADDVLYATDDEAHLYQSAQDMQMDAATANSFIKGYDGSVSTEVYVSAFREAYRKGAYGIAMTETDRSELSKMIRADQVDLAYKLGEVAAKYAVGAKQAEVDAKKTKTTKSDTTTRKDRKFGRIHLGDIPYTIEQMTKRQRASLEVLNRLAEALELDNIYLFESSVVKGKRQGFNGKYENGRIYLDIFAGLNGEQTILYTAAHELTHFIREYSPTKFKTFADFLFKNYAEQGVDVEALIRAQQAKARKNGRELSYDDAFEEVVADSCESFLVDSDIVSKIAELKTTDKTLWGKIKTFLKKWLDKVRALYKGFEPNSYEGQLVKEMVDKLDQLHSLWAEALVDASESYSNASAHHDTRQDSSKPKFSNRDFSSQVDAVLSGADTNSTHLKVMKTSKLLQEAGLPNLPILMTASHLKKIVSPTGHGLEVEMVKKLPDYISSPVMIADSLSRGDSIVVITEAIDTESRPVIAAILLNGKGRLDGEHIEANIMTSAYGRNNFQTFLERIAENNAVIYWNEKKSQDLSVSLGIQFPNAITSLRSNVIIHQAQSFVNTQNQNVSEKAAKLSDRDSTYMDAVNSGDMETAQRMVDKAARKAGYTVRAWHGTPIKGITVFDKAKIGSHTDDGIFGHGFYFTTNKTTADGYATADGETMPVFLAVKKPWWGLGHKIQEVAKILDLSENSLTVHKVGKGQQSVVSPMTIHSRAFTSHLIERGYDSVIVQHGTDNYEVVVFDSNQIKSADPVTYDDNGEVIPLSERFKSDKTDIRYSDRDSEGTELTEAQQEYFADSKVRDKHGNLLVMYHGTPNATFTTFRSGSYFTEHKWYAERYKEQGASSLSYKKTADNPDVYAVYLNIKKPFDTRNPEERRIFEEEYYRHYGMGTPLMESGLPDWMDGGDLQEFIEEMGYDYDGLILDEGAVGGYGDEVVSRGVSYMIFDPSQVKSVDNKTPTKDKDIRYSDRDSEGTELTEAQQEYFADSKVRDADGRLIPVWHGTKSAGFTVFKKAETGHFFTDNPEVAQIYAKSSDVIDPYSRQSRKSSKNQSYQVYLNITNPLVVEGDGREWHSIIDEEGIPRTTDSYVLEAIEKGYDGVIFHDIIDGGDIASNVYVALDSNQIKSTENKNPTKRKDIRYSERDSAYMDAVNAGDMETAQRMVDEAAKEAGYSSDVSWRMQHTAPNAQSDVSLYDLKKSGLIPSDYWDHPEWYTYSSWERQAFYTIKKALETQERWDAEGKLNYKGEPAEVKIWVYRAVDKTVNTKEGHFRNGDWVTPSYDYAVNEGKMNPNGYRIIKTAVSIKHLFWDGNSIAELGYDDGNNYAYRDTTNNRKLLDPVTYDSFGLVIPLSQRFKSRKDDVRYSDRDESLSPRAVLANVLGSGATTAAQRQLLANYKAKIAQIEADQQRLSEIDKQLRQLRSSKSGTKTPKLGKQTLIDKYLRERTTIIERMNKADSELLKLQATKPLQDLLKRATELERIKVAKKGADALKAQREKAEERERALKERYAKSRQEAVIRHQRTQLRGKIKRVVGVLDQMLRTESKKKHVPIELQKVVAEVLNLVNMDTVNAEERIKAIEAQMVQTRDPKKLTELADRINTIKKTGDRMQEHLLKLKAAYDAILTSKDPMIQRGAHLPEISKLIDAVTKEVGNTPLREMSVEQLEAVYDMYKAVLTTVRNANKAHMENLRKGPRDAAEAIETELITQKRRKTEITRFRAWAERNFWNMLKPVYAFKRIASPTLNKLFGNIRRGEDTYGRDIAEGRSFFQALARQYNTKEWDTTTEYKFTSSSGESFTLNLEQIMSLYAYAQRGEQALNHIINGGFLYDSKVVKKTKIGVEVVTQNANAYKISEETLGQIFAHLTDEQKQYVKKMQDYLSNVMGAKGNEVSLKLYGIKLFKESAYFPLHSAEQFQERVREAGLNERKLVNSGFTNKTVENATSPIVLTPFSQTWANHVHDMSMYHAFVLPLEDFYRTINHRDSESEADPSKARKTVYSTIESIYGKAATQYIDELLRDLNGGARSDARIDTSALLTKFKKAKTMFSASTIIQQPSSIGRAFAYIDPKYFVGKHVTEKQHKAIWDEMQKYAPVTILKDMGYFDTGIGASTTSWMTAKEYKGVKEKLGAIFKDEHYRGEVFSFAPAFADELTWAAIWEAAKRKVKAEQPNITRNQDYFKAVADLFTETITNTQVYDSVLSRSGAMRSKDGLSKMMTAFMAEPTTTLNMVYEGIVDIKSGEIKTGVRKLASVMTSIVLNGLLVSIPYAMRDDDEEETFGEKYLSSLVSSLVDGITVFNYLPFVKDIWSVLQGYDVERADMSLISDTVSSFEKAIELSTKNTDDMDKEELKEHSKDVSSAWLSLGGDIAAMLGVPFDNIIREAKAIFNAGSTIFGDRKGTAMSLGDVLEDTIRDQTPIILKGDAEGKTDRLYSAIVEGDSKYVARIKSTYKDEKSYTSAVRKALKENDPRITEAAQARLDGDTSRYVNIVRAIKREYNFSQDDIVAAVNSAQNDLTKDDGGTVSTGRDYDIYATSDINANLEQGDYTEAREVTKNLIKQYMDGGKTQAEAISIVKSGTTRYWKEKFLEAYAAGNNTELQRIRRALYNSGLYGSANDVIKTCQEWLKSSLSK